MDELSVREQVRKEFQENFCHWAEQEEKQEVLKRLEEQEEN
jgi:hypothetical protein